MAAIHAGQTVVMQINVFEVDPKDQDQLAHLLMQAVQSVSTVPGWISASVHKNQDGTRVTNYAQAADYPSWEAIVAELRKQAFFDRFRKLSKPKSVPLSR